MLGIFRSIDNNICFRNTLDANEKYVNHHLTLFQFTGKYAEGDGYEPKDDETLKQKHIGFVC